MRKTILLAISILGAFILGFYTNKLTNPKSITSTSSNKTKSSKTTAMNLGAFSTSLNVKNLKVSKVFYEKLGFVEFGGGMSQNYLIMKNGNALIGLFQGMFEGNILTFNPGWDENAENLNQFDDIRTIQKNLKNSGLSLISEADEKTKGPASIMLTDPDGNMILLDQHR
jgi:predicted enzyme related to lactoylglutathione lyase